ncbi:MAG: hypothetical protein K8963_09055 [Proteobacteria bacterium]|nr:hypothetical protein [Pseudomonadota bacterium]
MKAFVLFVLRRFAGTLARQLLAVAMVGIVLFITFVFFISLSRFAWVEIYPYRYVALLEADGLSIVRRGELDPLGHANIDNDIALEYEISRPHYKIRARTVARPPAQTGLVELDYWAVVTLEAFANDDSPLTIQELDTKHRCAVLTDYPAQYHQPQVFSPAVKVMNWKPDNLWPQYNEQAARHHEACAHPDNAIIHFQVNDTDGRAVGSEKLHYTIARGGSHTPSLAGR